MNYAMKYLQPKVCKVCADDVDFRSQTTAYSELIDYRSQLHSLSNAVDIGNNNGVDVTNCVIFPSY